MLIDLEPINRFSSQIDLSPISNGQALNGSVGCLLNICEWYSSSEKMQFKVSFETMSIRILNFKVWNSNRAILLEAVRRNLLVIVLKFQKNVQQLMICRSIQIGSTGGQ